MSEPLKTPNTQELITAINADGTFYPIEKLDAHVKNVPHLAVSVFLFCRGKLLIQQRAEHKYHSGGLWANTCCSHPRWNETPGDCAVRRLNEELGCTASLECFGKIDYAANVGNDLYENESAYCFVGELDHEHMALHDFNPDEVQAVKWLPLNTIRQELGSRPSLYTKWIHIYFQKHFDLILRASTVAS